MWFIHTCKIWISHFTDTLDFYWSADRVCDSVYINLLHVELNDSVWGLTSDVIRWTHRSVSVGWWYWPELYYSVIRLSISREVSTESRSGLWAAVRSVGTNVYGKPQHQNTQSSTGHRWTGNKSTIIRALILDPQLCVCNFCWGCEDVSFNSESVQTHEAAGAICITTTGEPVNLQKLIYQVQQEPFGGWEDVDVTTLEFGGRARS